MTTPGPATPTATPLLEARELRVAFPGRRRDHLVAVDGVDLHLHAGETLGLVGESGCGKTTVARALVGLQAPERGSILLEGRPLPARRSLPDRRAVQMVFQDPTSSLNPRLTVGAVLRQLLAVHFGRRGAAGRAGTADLLDLVGLPASVLERYPRELSGGQRQRVAIARALAVEPRVVVADEPTSALDVSVQATVLRLFDRLTTELGLGLIVISHNLAATRALCDRVDVMYLGRIVERGPEPAIFGRAAHPYTRALLEAAPSLIEGGAPAGDRALHGESPGATAVPTGCRLHPRCPRAEERCTLDDPDLLDVAGDADHRAACHFRDHLEETAP